jgi:copper transport protein
MRQRPHPPGRPPLPRDARGGRWGHPVAAVAVLLLAGVWLVAAAGAAAAHATLADSDPPAGASLARAPHALTLTFTEPPDLRLSSVRVLDAAGRPGPIGRPATVPGHPLALAVPLEHLGEGGWTVTWRVVSATDGHAAEGVFAFGVGRAGLGLAPVAAAQAAAGGTAPRPLAVAGRWGFALGLALLVGAAATGLAVFDRRLPGRPARLLGLAGGLAAAGLAGMTVAALAGAGVPLGRLLGSSTGHWLAWRAAALVVAAAAASLVVARPGRAWPLVAAGAAAAGGLLVHAMAGHAAAPSPLRPLHLLAQWAHLVAVGVWVGGLAWLLAGLGGRDGAGRAAAARRFSRLAAGGLAVVAVTGLARAVDEVGGWSALATSGFGRALDLKLALFAGLAAFGAVNHYRLVPAAAGAAARGVRRAGGRLRASVRGELGVAVAVLLAGALLAELPPAAGTRPARAAGHGPAVEASGSDYATSVRVTLTVSPGAAGPNRFAAAVADYDTGAPVAAGRVELTGSLAGRPDLADARLELARAADGRWLGQGRLLSVAGRWTLTTLVQRPDGGVMVPLQLDVPGPPAPQPAAGS